MSMHHRRPLGRFSITIAATFTLVLALAACGGAEDTALPAEPTDATSSVTPSAASSPAAPVSPSTESTDLGPQLTITFDGEEVSPNAEEIHLGTGEKLRVEIDSDRAGELHIHSAPEQFVQFAEGTTDSEIVVNNPGTVEVEDHDTSAVVALIEVH
jgi:FtsP/CotA-like multicopper oxidase with cupredoxin domain